MGLQQQLATGIDLEAQAQAVFSPAPRACQGQGWGGCRPGFHPRLVDSPSVQHRQTIDEHHLRALLGQRLSQHHLQFLLVVLAAGQHHFQGLLGGPRLAGHEQGMPAMLTGTLVPAPQGDSPGQHIPQGHSGGEGKRPHGDSFDWSIALQGDSGEPLLQPTAQQGQLAAAPHR